MATRQYIGARYVPEFFYGEGGSPEWVSGIQYDALVIVTRLGNSFTSRKPVPSNIGAPENNPEYWVSTGNYNSQIDVYREEVEELSDKIDYYKYYYFPEDYGAKGDGVTDDTQAIQDMLNAMEDGTCAIFTARKYIVSDELVVSKNSCTFSSGYAGRTEYASEIHTTATNKNLFKVTGLAANFTGLCLSGGGRGVSYGYVILFDADTVVQDGNVDAVIENCYISFMEQGIGVKGRNLTARNNTFSGVRIGIEFLQTTENIQLRGHIVQNNRFHGVQLAIKNSISNLLADKGNTIDSNVLDGGSVGLYEGYGGNMTISNNVVYLIASVSGGGNIILFNLGSTNEMNVIRGNILHINGKQFAGIGLTAGVNAIIMDNYIEKTARRGIYTMANSFSIIQNNIVKEAGSWGIQIESGGAGALLNNTTVDCSSPTAVAGNTEVNTNNVTT